MCVCVYVREMNKGYGIIGVSLLKCVAFCSLLWAMECSCVVYTSLFLLRLLVQVYN